MESKRVFPLSLEFYNNFIFYYPFGNSTAEDFLQGVSVADCREPAVLSLGCGDMRSPMFTIFNNFGLEGEPSDGFSGVRFVLNDRNASVLARNILFLYLCMHLPGPGVERKSWIASMWSLWYNHELQPKHHEMLLGALEELSQWSSNWQEWSECPLGKLVKFSSPATFATVKKVWRKWQSCAKIKSVKQMKNEREKLQKHFVNQEGGTVPREEGLRRYVERERVLKALCLLYSPEQLSKIKNEYLKYLIEGFVWAEEVLGIPIANTKTFVNPTFFEHEHGQYALHFVLNPYSGFFLSFEYTNTEISKYLGQECFLPVSDASFQLTPLLANCVQQFAIWLQATANMITKASDSSIVSFTFILEDAISLCFDLLHYPQNYPEIHPCFDAIYTSNLLDHVSPPALVFNALPLLKSTGTLFTETFCGFCFPNYLEGNFGFPPEHFPALLGVHCIGWEGQFSPAVSPYPNPRVFLSSVHTTSFIWRNVTSNLLFLNSIKEFPNTDVFLLNACRTATDPFLMCTGSVESFLCILHQFLKRVQSAVPVYQFLQPLSTKFKEALDLNYSHLVQLQTQSLLHGIHMHLTVTEDKCPICRGQPLESYIQQFTLSLDIDNFTLPDYEHCTFELRFTSSSDNYALVVKSFSITCSGSKLKITFFFPEECLSHYRSLCVKAIYQSCLEGKNVYNGPVEILKCSHTYDYKFMKQCMINQIERNVCPLGHIVKHLEESEGFKTVIAMNDACQAAIKKSKLDVKCIQSDKLQLSCGELKTTIVYPYAIDESIAHEMPNKQHTISVVVQRKRSLLSKEKSIYFIDPRNRIFRPRFHWGINVMEKYCNLQPLYYESGHPLFHANRLFMELFKHSLNGQKIFTLSIESKQVSAFVCVHDLRFSTVFTSPTLDVSYCFCDMVPRDLIHDFHALQEQFENLCNIIVDDPECKFLKDVFKYFSSNLHCPFPDNLNMKAIEESKLWLQFNHAILFPLYPNPADSRYQQYMDRVQSHHAPGVTRMFCFEEATVMGQGRKDACSSCESSAVPMKCGQCNRAAYCSKECQRKHWKVHKVFCNKDQEKEYTPCTKSAKPHPAESSKEESDSDGSKKESVSRKCSNCSKITLSLKRCKCQDALYCSVECQRLHRPQHKATCTAKLLGVNEDV